MKKSLSLSLAIMFLLGANTALAATNDDQKEIDVVKARLAEVEKKLAEFKPQNANTNSSFQWSGDMRLRYRNLADNEAKAAKINLWDERFRLNVSSKVNDNTTFFGRVTALYNNELGTTDSFTTTTKLSGTTYTSTTTSKQSDRWQTNFAYFETKNIFGSNAVMTAGRFGQGMGQTKSYFGANQGGVDGVKFTFANNNIKSYVGYARFGTFSTGMSAKTSIFNDGGALFGEVNAKLSDELTLSAMFLNENGANDTNGQKVIGAGLKYQFDKDWTFLGDWNQNSANLVNGAKPTFYVTRIQYKGANSKVPQSWGAYVEYHKADAHIIDGAVSDATVTYSDVRGYTVNFNQAIAKNTILNAYYTIGDKSVSTGKDRGHLTRIQAEISF